MLQKLQLPQFRRLRWTAALAPLGWQAAGFVMGVLAGGGGLFRTLHPFGLAVILGVQSGMALPAAAGVMLGELWLLDPLTALRYLGAAAAALAGRRLFREKFWPAAAAGCCSLLLVQLLLSLSGLTSLPEALAALGDAVIAVLMGLAMRKRQCGGEEAVSSTAVLMLLTACLQRFALGVFQPGLILFGAVGLALARRGRLRETAVLSIGMAASLMAASPELTAAGVGTALGCLMAVVFAPGEPLACSALFLAGSLPGLLAVPTAADALRFLGCAAAAELLTWLIPQKALAAAESALPPEAAQKSTLAGAAGRLTAVGEALGDIADTVNAVCEKMPPPAENFNWVAERISEELCRRCSRCAECWGSGYSGVMDGFFHLKPILEKKGCITEQELPVQLKECIHPAALCSVSQRCWAMFRSRREARAQAGVLRAAVTEQYSAVAGALTQLAEDLGRDTCLDTARSGRVTALFENIGMEPLETAVTLDTLGRMEVRVTVNRTAFTVEEQQQLAWEVGRICRRKFTMPSLTHCRTVTSLRFAEQPVYCPRFGTASIPAQSGNVCGDAADHFCDSFGAAHLLLCDGMGTGREAAVDGRMAAALTGKLLRTGFAGDAAARLVNVALSLKSEEESGATLDLLSVDLYTGKAVLYKAGAVSSFVIRGDAVRTVQGSSLPVGILPQVVGRSQQLELGPGDRVVLVSDGALADGEEWVVQQLRLCARSGDSPEKIARTLTSMARRRTERFQQPDDITAAVLQLEKTR